MKDKYNHLKKWNETIGNDRKEIPEHLIDAFDSDMEVTLNTVESSQRKCEYISGRHVLCM